MNTKNRIAIIGVSSTLSAQIATQLPDAEVVPMSITSAPRFGKTDIGGFIRATDRLVEVKPIELKRSVIPTGHFKTVHNKKRGRFNDY